jgi:magnesium chelatase subunit D
MSSRSARTDLPLLLECVAINDALDGVLLVGASGALLESAADELDELMQAAGACAVDRVRLGSADTEDALWGVPNLPPEWNSSGLLVPPEGTSRIVIVPDLARLSLAAARAGVMMLGAESVAVERRSGSQLLAVRHRWLAAVAEADLGNVSRHLLERFAIRIRAAEVAAADRRAALRARLARKPGIHVATQSAERVRDRARLELPFSDEAFDTALELAGPRASLRPAIALMQIARSIASLDHLESVDLHAVASAAAATGQSVGAAPPPGNEETTSERADPTETGATAPVEPKPAAALQYARESGEAVAGAAPADPSGQVVRVSEETVLEGVVLPAPTDPIDIDSIERPRDYASLRLPWRQHKSASSGRGPVIGSRRSDTLQDLAVLDTLFAAAPFQKQRRLKLKRRSRDIILRREDLRSYRRAPSSGELLVLVLDYTTPRAEEWLDLLDPFIASAYTERAELCIVQVGAARAQNEFRSERILARNILVPSVAAALNVNAGRASPLADGLLQAYRTLQQTMTHGRSSKRTATLVVVSDGRCNVPLEASRIGAWDGRAGQRGIEDAKKVARDIRVLPHVRRLMIDPGPRALRGLPQSLGVALGADIIKLDDQPLAEAAGA